MKKALIVIDMQNVCVGKNHNKFFNYNDNLIDIINNLIKENDTVIYIRNLMKDNFLNKLAPVHVFDGTEESKLADELLIKDDIIFGKYKGDAFTNPELLNYLLNNNIDTIEIVGVDGGGCVSLTALGGLKNGLDVILNTNAIGTILKKKQKKYYKVLKEKGAKFK